MSLFESISGSNNHNTASVFASFDGWHIHIFNLIGGLFFATTLWAHMPTLAYYTAAVGAVTYTIIGVRQIIAALHDIRAWASKFRKNH